MSMTTQINLTHDIMRQTPPADTWRSRLSKRFIQYLALFSLWASLLLFVAAIILIMSQRRLEECCAPSTPGRPWHRGKPGMPVDALGAAAG
jgi:hypothetical protein